MVHAGRVGEGATGHLGRRGVCEEGAACGVPPAGHVGGRDGVAIEERGQLEAALDSTLGGKPNRAAQRAEPQRREGEHALRPAVGVGNGDRDAAQQCVGHRQQQTDVTNGPVYHDVDGRGRRHDQGCAPHLVLDPYLLSPVPRDHVGVGRLPQPGKGCRLPAGHEPICHESPPPIRHNALRLANFGLRSLSSLAVYVPVPSVQVQQGEHEQRHPRLQRSFDLIQASAGPRANLLRDARQHPVGVVVVEAGLAFLVDEEDAGHVIRGWPRPIGVLQEVEAKDAGPIEPAPGAGHVLVHAHLEHFHQLDEAERHVLPPRAVGRNLGEVLRCPLLLLQEPLLREEAAAGHDREHEGGAHHAVQLLGVVKGRGVGRVEELPAGVVHHKVFLDVLPPGPPQEGLEVVLEPHRHIGHPAPELFHALSKRRAARLAPPAAPVPAGLRHPRRRAARAPQVRKRHHLGEVARGSLPRGGLGMEGRQAPQVTCWDEGCRGPRSPEERRGGQSKRGRRDLWRPLQARSGCGG
mmetsp:Transcript_54224/g.172111  ORF Transcript_54224/g.172111 Transcript_54224/m.172111 type:complete len:521 (-) Transcript_54224:1838-3400(-)